MESLSKIIQKRYSTVAFSEQDLDPKVLEQLFEAARWAASCFNEQPWRFIFALRKNTTEFERILGCLFAANQAWAKTAPLLMITAARSRFAHKERSNPHARHDLGQAISQLSLQAADLGLSIHQMAGFDSEKAQKELNIPEPFEAVTAVALGYPGKIEELDPELQERAKGPRTRKALTEIVFQASWGNSWGNS